MRRAHKTDANQKTIIDAMRVAGATVHSLAGLGNGVPDLLVGYKGCTILMEVKDGDKNPSKQKLTDYQVTFLSNWTGGPVAVVKDVESALRVLRMVVPQ